MRRLSALYLAALATGAWAQSTHRPVPEMPLEKHGAHVPPHRIDPGAPKGSSYYSEPFQNDMDGWTVQNPLGNVPWAWTITGPAPTTSTYPDPPLNTTTGGWMMVDDDALGHLGDTTETWLISPPIDLSMAPPNLLLEFDQYFQEWDAGDDHLFVGVSTDGGNNWTEEEVNEGVGRDGRPNPEQMGMNISDYVTGNPANVQLRFRYRAAWAYGWQVDNIRITDLPNNDMAILQSRLTLFDFTNTGPDAQPYTIYPIAHLVPMEMNLRDKNKGFMAQHNVVTSLAVTGPGGDDFNTSNSPVTANYNEISDVVFEPFEPNGNVGDYQVSFTVSQDETDEVPANNTAVGMFSVSDGIYALDQGATDNYIRQGLDERAEQFEVGSKYQMQVDDEVVAVQVAVHEGTAVGASLYAAVYELSTDPQNVHPGLLGDFSPEHLVTQGELNANGGSTFITIPFTTPVQLTGGETYQVMAGAYEPSDSVRFCTSGFLPSQIALIHYPNLSAGFEFTFSAAPMVRAVMASGGIGIAEENGHISVVDAYPNPFQGACTVDFELAKQARVQWALYDMLGRTVQQVDLGLLGAGKQRYMLDGSQLPAGIYQYALTINGVRTTGKLQHRN